MAQIIGIDCVLHTGTGPGPFGEDGGIPVVNGGSVYLCIAGREFYCNTMAGSRDFAPNKITLFSFGAGANPTVHHPLFNDPNQMMHLASADVAKFPAWIRFVPTASNRHWHLLAVLIRVRALGLTPGFLTGLGAPEHLWLGAETGGFLFLKPARRIGKLIIASHLPELGKPKRVGRSPVRK